MKQLQEVRRQREASCLKTLFHNPTVRDVARSTFAGVGAEQQHNDPAGWRRMNIQKYAHCKSLVFHVDFGTRLDV